MKKQELPPEVFEFFKQQGAKGGKLGGSKAWEGLTPEQRGVRAKKAVDAREAKRATEKLKSGSTQKRAEAKNANKKPSEAATMAAAAKKERK